MKMSEREQLDCLILELEKNLDKIRQYKRERDTDAKKSMSVNELYLHNHGMARGAEFAESLISRTLGAAKKQREAEK